MHDPQEYPNRTELGVFFIFQDCHVIAATNLSYSCRTKPHRDLGNWQLLSLSIQTYHPASPHDKTT